MAIYYVSSKVDQNCAVHSLETITDAAFEQIWYRYDRQRQKLAV